MVEQVPETATWYEYTAMSRRPELILLANRRLGVHILYTTVVRLNLGVRLNLAVTHIVQGPPDIGVGRGPSWS